MNVNEFSQIESSRPPDRLEHPFHRQTTFVSIFETYYNLRVASNRKWYRAMRATQPIEQFVYHQLCKHFIQAA